MTKQPLIGLRTIKTALAVFLCFLIDSFREMSSPFYSAIACIYAMQPTMETSLTSGKNRMSATLFGGFWGIFFLFVERLLNLPTDTIFRGFLLSFMMIPIIKLTVALNRKTTTFLTCVVFLSVTVSHGSDPSPYGFALNRMFDTLIGIAVSLFINAIPGKKSR